MDAKVIGSVGAVLKSRAAMARETNRDARAPDAMPMRARRRVLARTLRWTFAVVAPRAMRMPISCVRWVTE